MHLLLVLLLLVSGAGAQEESLALYRSLPCDAAAHDARHHEVPSGIPEPRRIRLGTGVELEYVEQGQPGGTPLILLHGLSDSWHSFESVLAQLPPTVHAFALSGRGHGDSDRPDSGYTPEQFAADVASFVRLKGLGPVVVAGHSMGGVHALQFALHYPGQTKGLVLISSDAAFAQNPGLPEFYSEAMQLRGPMPEAFMDAFQRSTLAQPIDSAYLNLLIGEGLKVPVRVFQAAFTGLMETDLRGSLPRIQCPVLVLWGGRDAICRREGQETLRRRIPGAQLLIYQEAGHALHWEEPQRCARDLFSFLQPIHPPAGTAPAAPGNR
ncbi:MAG TPA: alpha/beta hydrolase [Chitinophagaceae bacterium]|nr:alpha/beta hydrolase [Chitinophagaceae bacterium]